MAKSVKENYILNLLNSGSSLLFPLIVFPYASRIMLADGIGHIDFFQSIMQYVLLITCFGIPMYAIKEIAKSRDDLYLKNKTLLEILSLQILLSFFAYIIVFIISIIVPEIKSDQILFYIFSLSIFLNTIGCEWYFQGVEDFKYITLRSIIVKAISLLLLFIFVHARNDIYYYALVLVLGTYGGNVFNFIRICRTISCDFKIKELNPIKHLLPALHVFVLTFITTIYVQLNSVMLGFMSDERSVGLFSSASKISHLLLIVGTTLSTTMLPRMSNMIAQNKNNDFNHMCINLIKFIIMLSVPLTIWLLFSSTEIIHIICGNSYDESIITLMIMAPIIIIIGLSNVIGIQILFPMGKVNLVIKATAMGALVNVVLNLFLIPIYKHNGSAISTLTAETIVTISLVYMSKHLIDYKFIFITCINYLFASFIMMCTLFLLPKISTNDLVNLLYISCVGIFIYVIVLWLLKDNFFLRIIKETKKNL